MLGESEKKYIYFDHNATTLLRGSVVDLLKELRDVGNPSSQHRAGQKTRNAIELARMRVAKFLAVKNTSVIFTSGGTEANALAICLAQSVGASWHLYSAVEHPCVPGGSEKLIQHRKSLGVAPNGVIDLKNLASEIERMRVKSSNNGIVSVQLVSHENGVLQPIVEIASLLPKGVMLHVDAVQAVGKTCISELINQIAVISEENPAINDKLLLSISGHKFGALTGVGALVVPESFSPAALWKGGSQEFRHRPGTENSLGIISMGLAIEEVASNMHLECEHISQLLIRLEKNLSNGGRWSKMTEIAGKNSPRVCNTAMLIAPHGYSEELLMALDLRGIAVSAGAACSSGEIAPITSLSAMGYCFEKTRRGIRVSLGYSNTAEEIDQFCRAWEDVLENMKTV